MKVALILVLIAVSVNAGQNCRGNRGAVVTTTTTIRPVNPPAIDPRNNQASINDTDTEIDTGVEILDLRRT